jgi:membrane protease YdiL (CAAX protease family)
MALVAVVASELVVSVVGALLAVHSGLSLERALGLMNDPHRSPLFTSTPWILALTGANEAALAVTLLIWVVRHRPHIGHVFPIGFPTARTLIGGLLVVFGFGPLAEFLGELVYRHVQLDVTAEHLVLQMSRSASPGELLLVLLVCAVVPAFVEEALFRGLITRAFERGSHRAMVLVPSVLFALSHFEPTQVAGTFVLGVAFGLVRLYAGSLVPCVIAHAIYNTWVILAERFIGPGEHVLSYGRVGIGLGVAALGVLTMVSAPGDILVLPRRHG